MAKLVKGRLLMNEGLNVQAKPITIVVGTGKLAETFYMHETIVKTHSDFFTAALREGWKEAKNGVVQLPEDNPEVFTIFSRFAYTGRVHSRRENDHERIEEGHMDEEWYRLLEAWALGDKLGAMSFKDAVIDAMCQKGVEDGRWLILTSNQRVLGMDASNGLKRLLVDIVMWSWPSDLLAATKTGPWPDFFWELAMRLHATSETDRQDQAPFLRVDCAYHDHVAAGKACYKTMSFP